MGSIENISELCRLCLVKDQVNVPIFEENATKEQTFVKINSCLPVKVSRDDSLPKKICDGCSCKLDMLYTFRNTSVDSEKQLLKWLNQAGLSCSQSAVKDPLASTKPEVTIKQETFEPTDSRDDLGLDTHSYIMQQQKLPYSQEFEFGEPSESNVGLMTDEPAPKKAKRAAALNKASVETDEDDLDAAMQITKAEDEDSDEIDQPEYVEAPSTSADDQPGPSGVNKTTVEAPFPVSTFFENCDPLRDEAAGVREQLHPKSRYQYMKEYETFSTWRNSNYVDGVTEDILLRYVSDLMEKFAPNSVYTKISMLKTLLKKQENIDISGYGKVFDLMKRKSKCYKANKAQKLTAEEVTRYLLEAPDESFLLEKVITVFGIFGACRREELVTLRANNIEDTGSLILVTIENSNNRSCRKFVITEDETPFKGCALYRKYAALRPPGLESQRFFVDYRNGRCTKQLVGINKISSIPKKIAKFLKLKNPETYTGHSLRRSGTAVLAENGVHLLTLKQFRKGRSEEFFEDSTSALTGGTDVVKQDDAFETVVKSELDSDSD
nr:PREDICTED: uncharacterized protein LOC656007 isoform X13 [Tribolium castaneum]|eukprot:XP_015834127.1 PREDICTED: uncharacterized protein LOC656007 isoform X13 [Tribolium castaneum]